MWQTERNGWTDYRLYTTEPSAAGTIWKYGLGLSHSVHDHKCHLRDSVPVCRKSASICSSAERPFNSEAFPEGALDVNPSVCLCVRYSGHSVWGVHTGVLVPWWSKLRTLLLPPDPYSWFPSCGNGGSGTALRTDAQTNLSPNHIVQICLGMLLHAQFNIWVHSSSEPLFQRVPLPVL